MVRVKSNAVMQLISLLLPVSGLLEGLPYLQLNRITGLLLLGLLWVLGTAFYVLFFYAVGESSERESPPFY